MKLTILMYHKIDELPQDGRPTGNYVDPRAFVEQLDALSAWGYETIRFEQWLAYRAGGPTAPALPPKPLIVTFDDGYRCFDRNAWPALRARRMSATMFVVASQVGGINVWDPPERREPLLDARRLRELQDDGVHIGAHGLTHLPLARIPADQALSELTRSRAMLSDLLGRDPLVVAYPFSNQSRAVRRLVEAAGYAAAVRGKGRMNRRSTDPYALRRIKVEPTTTVSSLRRTLLFERYARLA